VIFDHPYNADSALPVAGRFAVAEPRRATGYACPGKRSEFVMCAPATGSGARNVVGSSAL